MCLVEEHYILLLKLKHQRKCKVLELFSFGLSLVLFKKIIYSHCLLGHIQFSLNETLVITNNI